MPRNSVSSSGGRRHSNASLSRVQPQHGNKIFASISARFRRLFRRSTKSRRATPPQVALSKSRITEEVVAEDKTGLADRNAYTPVAPTVRPCNPSDDTVFLSEATSAYDAKQIIAATFQGAHDVKISGNPHFLNIGQHNSFNHSGMQGLDILKQSVSFSALHDSSAQDPERKCHPGTRENVLKQMRNWIDDPNAPQRIFWLHGPAGVGKSAIAQTISQSYTREKVVATFFFFKSDTSRSDGDRLFPTLAWQLAKSIPGARDRITRALNDDSDLPMKAIEIQFEHIIAQPMREIVSTSCGIRRVIIIDGVDECSSDKLQQRFLKLITGAVTDFDFPLRFLISSRPEAHIQESFRQIHPLFLSTLDLADIDGAYTDIEHYLKSEFARIARDQQLDPKTWPGQDVIDKFVSKSSGHFIYASTIIKFVADEYSSATSQLDIVLGLEPTDGKSPFADLDALYVEILQRQPDQSFLKDFFALLIVRTCHNSIAPAVCKDTALLLNVDERGLHRKLRGMHSLLKIRPGFDIDVHHKSFPDFLQDAPRSRQYYTSAQHGTRRFMELVTDALVRYASRVMKQSRHPSVHFAPAMGVELRCLPFSVKLPFPDLEQALQPLLSLQDELLKLPKLSVPWKYGSCNDCIGFYVIHDLLLHLCFLRGTSDLPFKSQWQPQLLTWQLNLQDSTAFSMFEINEIQTKPHDLDCCLSSLLDELRKENSRTSLSEAIFGLICALLRFDCVEVASKVCTVSDAQNLVDLIFYLVNDNYYRKRCGPSTGINATRLALEIYARIPILPRPLFLEGITDENPSESKVKLQGKEVHLGKTWHSGINAICQSAFIWAILSHANISPLLGIYRNRYAFKFVSARKEHTLRKWRSNENPSVSQVNERILEVAKAVQYMHSLGILLGSVLSGDEVAICSNSRAQIDGYGLSSQWCRDTASDIMSLAGNSRRTYDKDIFMFGCLCYEIYYDTNIAMEESVGNLRKTVIDRPPAAEAHENIWQLIQKCCAMEPKSRPTIHQVVREIESWM